MSAAEAVPPRDAVPESRPVAWSVAWKDRVLQFGRELGVTPEHDALLLRAFTHRSLAEDSRWGDNERLEFLGDSVLNLVVSEHLYRSYPEHAEGQLTKLKIRYVSEPSLAEAATLLGLGELLAIAAGDQAAGGRERPSTLSDAFEAVLGALYLASGLDAAREFVVRELIERVDPHVMWDHKSRLQELLQERERVTPVYSTRVESGPAHDRVFSSEVVVEDKALGHGRGRSKKLAEQAAAADALARIEDEALRRHPRKKATKPLAAPDDGARPAAFD